MKGLIQSNNRSVFRFNWNILRYLEGQLSAAFFVPWFGNDNFDAFADYIRGLPERYQVLFEMLKLAMDFVRISADDPNRQQYFQKIRAHLKVQNFLNSRPLGQLT